MRKKWLYFILALGIICISATSNSSANEQNEGGAVTNSGTISFYNPDHVEISTGADTPKQNGQNFSLLERLPKTGEYVSGVRYLAIFLGLLLIVIVYKISRKRRSFEEDK